MVAATQQLPEIERRRPLQPRRADSASTADLYINDMLASMSEKKVVGAGSPIARRCAFVGHFKKAKNTAAVIELFVFIAAPIMPKLRPTWYAKNGTSKCSAIRPYLLQLLTAGCGPSRRSITSRNGGLWSTFCHA